MSQGNLFPIRLLGFGFYWAWLFLTCVSPSMIFGSQKVDGIPLETLELAFRFVFILLSIIVSRWNSTGRIIRILLFASVLAGTISTGMVFFSFDAFSLPAIILMACADAAMFMLWLCFFGNKKVGEIAVYLALSYAVGAALCLVITYLAFDMTRICTIALPLLSGISFFLSYKHYGTQEDSFSGSFVGLKKRRGLQADTQETFPYMGKLIFSLGLYAMMFSSITSMAFSNNFEGGIQGPYIEAPCCLIIGIALAFLLRHPKKMQATYYVYRMIPLVFALGVVFLLINEGIALVVSSAFIMFGYLLFEVLALNDLCNALKIRSLSAIKVIGIARLGITVGMLTGWILGMLSSQIAGYISPVVFIGIIDVLALIISSTLLFTEKEIFAVQGVTDERTILEKEEQKHQMHAAEVLREASGIEEALTVLFGDEWKMSNREKEVLALLLKGKTTQYISEKLYIAQGTTKTHIYNIYQKLNIHTKMELLDMFDEFREKNHL